jgi:hypothetical protein
VLQLVAGVALVVIGLYIGLFADAPPDMRLFGGVLAAVGVLGLIAAVLLQRRRQGG